MPDHAELGRRRCMSCEYGPVRRDNRSKDGIIYAPKDGQLCYYLQVTGKSRGCPAGRDCTKYKPRDGVPERDYSISFAKRKDKPKPEQKPKPEPKRRAYMTEEKRAQILNLFEQGYSKKLIAKKMGCSPQYISSLTPSTRGEIHANWTGPIKIREAVESGRATILEMADVLQLTRDSAYGLAKGRRRIKPEEAKRLADAYGGKTEEWMVTARKEKWNG